MKYIKKRIIIDAIQFTRDNWNDVVKFTNGEVKGIEGKGRCIIPTSEGDMICHEFDYIIKEPFDKERIFYPCKEDIFNLTYDKYQHNTIYTKRNVKINK